MKRGVLGMAGRGLSVLEVGVGLEVVAEAVTLAVVVVLEVLGVLGMLMVGLSGWRVVGVSMMDFLMFVDAGVLLIEELSLRLSLGLVALVLMPEGRGS